MLLLLATACSHCPEGYAEGEGGQCISNGGDDGDQVAGDGQLLWSEIAESIPACAPAEAGDELDIVAGCVSGVCIGAGDAEVEDALGSALSCDGDTCEYANGVTAYYEDGGVVTFALEAPFGGHDEHGLGVSVGLGCFVDVFSAPDAMTAYLENGVAGIWALGWYDAGLSIYDDDAFGADLGDWIIDQLYIDGATN